MTMFPNVSASYPLEGSNLTGPFNETFQIAADLNILFQPEHVLIALYVPLILLSLVANVLLIVVAVKCNYTKRWVKNKIRLSETTSVLNKQLFHSERISTAVLLCRRLIRIQWTMSTTSYIHTYLPTRT